MKPRDLAFPRRADPRRRRARCWSRRRTDNSRRRRARPRRRDGRGSASRAASELINVHGRRLSDANGPVRPRPSPGRFRGFTRTDAPVNGHAFQRRAGYRSASASRSTPAAAWPAARFRKAREALDRLLYDLLDKQDEGLPLPLQQQAGAAAVMDQGPPSSSRARARAHRAERRHRDCTDAVAEAIPLTLAGTEPEEGRCW